MKSTIVLQARMGSSRYPGKMLTDIAGRTLLERVLMRHESITGETHVLAIPETSESDVMVAVAEARGWRVFRGSESDVLSRYAGAIRAFGLERVIRATGDNPIIDPGFVRQVLDAPERFVAARGRGYPKGSGVEGVIARALLEADAETRDPYDREHVMPFVYKHPERYPLFEFHCPYPEFADCRVTVDTPEDIERTRALFADLGDDPDQRKALEWVRRYQERR